MKPLQIERVGGIAGVGGAGARIRSLGQVAHDSLSLADQKSVDALFKNRGQVTPSPMRDGFSYRISRTAESGVETIEVPESMVPAAIARCVKDELI